MELEPRVTTSHNGSGHRAPRLLESLAPQHYKGEEALSQVLVSPIDMNTLDNLNRPSQHISACSSLHHLNGALTLAVESSLVLSEEWWTEKGKLIFLMPRPAAIYIGFGATSEISPLP
jgi:hypothetical protein